MKFTSVLIANRGEIAVRAIRTLKRLGIKSVVVHSDVDRATLPVRLADQAINLPGKTSAETYLNIRSVVTAALSSGSQAIFPGYGFLSESKDFAVECEKAKLRFVGPTPKQIEEFGLKHRSREIAAAAGVPLTPGTGLLKNVDEALKAAHDIGFPVMLKSTAGGGGIGLARCDDATAIKNAFESVQRLGASHFRDNGILLERCIVNARHVEVQIFGDGKGRVAAVGERDCSLQRRNQKVIEETPAPNLPSKTRAALLDAAVRLGEAISYRSAGTVEFIYDASRDEFYFLEVNTRLQVEHPITEEVMGVDLVEQMLRVAADEEPDWNSLTRTPKGVAMEARIYAEDPSRNFQPCPGELTEVNFSSLARMDSWIETGTVVSPFYDPMLAKLIVHGNTRKEALEKLNQALRSSRISGIVTNMEYLQTIATNPSFIEGNVSTRFLDTLPFHTRAIEVLNPGTQTSVQDFPGRLGYWNIGVSPSGPMDDEAHRIANQIVGNAPSAAALECTLVGPSLRFNKDTIISLTGAKCDEAKLDGEKIPMWSPVHVKKGQTLTTGKVSSGCRFYIAVQHGLDVPSYLGSKSTFSLGQFGGHSGRVLRTGDMLFACEDTVPSSPPKAAAAAIIPKYTNEWEIGVVYGPHGAPDFFAPESIDEFLNSPWKVHHNSNRLGVRLVGPKPKWTRSSGGEAGLHPSNIHDCEYAIGSINFTGDSPVILTCDGPSLGGFVCPFTVARAELWKVGQVKPGDSIRFKALSIAQANELELAQRKRIETLKPHPAVLTIDNKENTKSAIIARIAASGHHPEIVYRQAGDTYILIEYGENVLDLALRMRVYLMMEKLNEIMTHNPTSTLATGIQEQSPGVRSLQIRYEPNCISQSELVKKLLQIEESLPNVDNVKIRTRVLHLPMTFEDSATLGAVKRYQDTVRNKAPWLPRNAEFIRRINGLDSIDQVQDIIFKTSYLVLGLGDVYLGAPCAVPIDPRHRLLTSKYNPARTFTAEGTVGIGGVYMCIYGMDSPGGYQLIGRTLPIWNKFTKNAVFKKDEPWLLRFFDQVRFYPVSEPELEVMRAKFQEGVESIKIEEEVFDFAQHNRFLKENAADIASFQAKQKKAFDQEVALWANEDSAAAVAAAANAEPEANVSQGVGTPVQADTSGSIWKMLVEPGSKVKRGQPILVIEAMKMELEVQATESGTLTAFAARQGTIVSVGDTLAWIDTSKS